MTFAVSHYPVRLICFLKETYGAVADAIAPGITYISGLLFPIQILQLPKLDPDEYLWLSRLRRHLAKDDLDCLSRAYLPKQRNPLYRAAMNLVLRANPEESREGKEMLEALQELFPEEFREKNMLLEEQQKKLMMQQAELMMQAEKIEQSDQEVKMLRKQIEELKKPGKQNRKLEKLKKKNRKLKKKLNLRKIKHDMKSKKETASL